MRIGVPIRDGVFSSHFGRCNALLLCEVDPDSHQISQDRLVPRRSLKCESLPQWLKKLGVEVVVTGGIGTIAEHRLKELGIRVSAGHGGEDPQAAVIAYLADPIEPRENPCKSFEHRHHHCR